MNNESMRNTDMQRMIIDIDQGGFIIDDWEINYHGGTERNAYIVLTMKGKSEKTYQMTCDIALVEEVKK